MVTKREMILGGLWGAVVGDALGVPVEFQSRDSLRADPVTDMRGYGTHGQPPGTWSDDSSLMLCTVEGLKEGFFPWVLAELFVRWRYEAHWTPWGKVFDIGATTMQAIKRLKEGAPAFRAGLTDDFSNGNGSLMRILPVAIKFAGSTAEEMIDFAHRSSALTHRHTRSQMACGLYCLVARALLDGHRPSEAYEFAAKQGRWLYRDQRFATEITNFQRVLSGEIARLSENDVKSSGYVVHTLEASIWCLLNTGSFPEAVLKGVNLGDDTDTTGIAIGGLAGLYYGVDAIPEEWLGQLARREDIAELFDDFTLKSGVIIGH